MLGLFTDVLFFIAGAAVGYALRSMVIWLKK